MVDTLVPQRGRAGTESKERHLPHLVINIGFDETCTQDLLVRPAPSLGSRRRHALEPFAETEEPRVKGVDILPCRSRTPYYPCKLRQGPRFSYPPLSYGRRGPTPLTGFLPAPPLKSVPSGEGARRSPEPDRPRVRVSRERRGNIRDSAATPVASRPASPTWAAPRPTQPRVAGNTGRRRGPTQARSSVHPLGTPPAQRPLLKP